MVAYDDVDFGFRGAPACVVGTRWVLAPLRKVSARVNADSVEFPQDGHRDLVPVNIIHLS